MTVRTVAVPHLGYRSFTHNSLYIIRAMFIIIRGLDVLWITFGNHQYFLCFPV